MADDTLVGPWGEITTLMVSHDLDQVRRTPIASLPYELARYPFWCAVPLCVVVRAAARRHQPSRRRPPDGVLQRRARPGRITGVSAPVASAQCAVRRDGGFAVIGAGDGYAKRRSKLPPDTLIGVFLALTLGLGLCLLVAVTRQFNVHQVEAVLFGSLLTVTDMDLVLLVFAGAVVTFLLMRHYNELLLDSLSPPLATARGINSAFLEYGFALVLTVAILVSLKMIGALLVEALVVVPAAAARNVARGTRAYLAWSVLVAFIAGAGGLAISTRVLVPTGAAVVLAASLIFFVTLGVGALRRSA
jgi:ABC-type Mn2+/Zn2+ transport system permease subunit